MKDIKLELKYFNWNKETRTLSGELSTLPLQNMNLPFHITIENPNTKQSRVFRYLKTETDQEGDIQAWRYENLSHGLKLNIWND